jgi:hypothetical protein
MIVAGFVILTALALAALISDGRHWKAKLCLIVAVPVFAVAVHHALDGYRGYPTTATPPKEAQLLASVVAEPEPGDSGHIDLWLLAGDTPRAYRVPYTRELHETLEGAAADMKRGVPVQLRRIDRARFHRYRLPPIRPPRKERP